MLEFNGKQIKIELDYNTMCELEEMGISISELSNKPMSIIRTLIFFALKKEDNKITMKEVGRQISEYLKNGGKLEAISEAIEVAIKDSGFFPNNNK